MRAVGSRNVFGRNGTLVLAALACAAPAFAAGDRAPQVAPIPADQLELSLGSGVTLELVLVRAGTFRQGSPASERGRGSDEAPREVRLTRDYYIGKYEVTVEQFTAFVDATDYETEAERGKSGGYGLDGKKLRQSPRYSWREPGYAQSPRHPVSLVTYGDALAFTRWLSERAGRAIDLPTEAEWEHASRAGTSTRFYAGEGDALAAKIGWLSKNAPRGARAVGQLAPNALGLFDTSGNVHEWCLDWYGPYEPAGRATDPVREVPPAGDRPRRVLRGGSFLRPAKDLRSAARYRNDPGSRNADNGFRIVASTSALPAAAGERAPEPTGEASARAAAAVPGAAGAPAPAAPGSSGSLLRVGIWAAAGLFGASVVSSLVRGLGRRGNRSRGAASELMLKPAKDGFWVVAPDRLRGHTLRYRVNGPAGPARATVELEPSPGGSSCTRVIARAPSASNRCCSRALPLPCCGTRAAMTTTKTPRRSPPLRPRSVVIHRPTERMRPAIVAVHAASAEQREHAGRTRRALSSWPLLDTSAAPLGAAADALGSGAVWLVRAGAWPRTPVGTTLPWPAPSHTGAPLCAFGAVCPAPGAVALSREAATWRELLRSTGGDLSRAMRRGRAAPPAASVFLDAVLAPRVLGRVARGEPLEVALAATLRDVRARVVRHAPLDVFDDSALRVAQVVTSVQQGGAERVAIDLATELPQLGVRARVFALYAARRAALPSPPDTIEIAALAPAASEPELIERLARELSAWGTDLAHTHLLDARQLEQLAARGHRSLVTVHNTAASWPAGLRGLSGDAAALLVACAHAVESELAAHAPATPRRTVWNGIRPALPGATGWRERLGVPAQALVLLAIANPRPQKRLELLPAIARATEAALLAAGDARPLHLVIAGSTKPVPAPAADAFGALEREIQRHALEHVHLPGSVDDVAGLLAAADVLVSPSAHEGLSLAHLEALAAGVPVVASGAGGTAELAELTPSLVHLPLAASPELFARAALAALRSRAPDGPRLVRERFGAERMARAYARLYPRAHARRPAAQRDGLLLVSNNFSTGGAQSSARQLLLALGARGVRVRAAVLEEQPEYPTPGRRALEAAGVPVLALPPPAELPARDAVPRLVAAIEGDPPRAVLLWNVIVEHKLRLAESLLDIPLFDVSPGEMYFASLARYFAAPSSELPYRTARDYGARLAGMVVKFEAEAELARATLGLEARVIPNGVPLGARRSGHSSRGHLVIGTAARLHPDKRLGDLIEALRLAAPRLPPHVLRIAGGIDGAAEAHALELRERARGLHVEWLGELADPRAFLAGLDLFALVAEPAGCPNASLEAMAHGLPVLATAVGGMSEQIVPGTGRLVPARDAAAFADALVELAASPELRAGLGRAAREHVRRVFSLDLMVQRYAELCGVLAPPPTEREARPPVAPEPPRCSPGLTPALDFGGPPVSGLRSV